MQKCSHFIIIVNEGVIVLSLPIIKSHKSYTNDPNTTKFNMHTHGTYEIYCFLSGNAKYFVEGNIYPLKAGDILIMKKAEAHSLLISNHSPYERIVINFNSDAICENLRSNLVEFLDSRPLGERNRFPVSLLNSTNWLYYLKKICESDNINIKSIYLTTLLFELYENYPKIKPQEMTNDKIFEIVKYINSHLSEELSLDIICKRFFISKPHINRKFKKIIGSTVWEYITTKRLFWAKELLESGVPPKNVYLKCGFNEYTTFFRAYKTKFGINPKNSKHNMYF